MSFSASSAARSSSFAAISFALSSRTSEPSQMMRSLSSRSKTFGAITGSAIGACSGLSRIASNLSKGSDPIRPVRRRQRARRPALDGSPEQVYRSLYSTAWLIKGEVDERADRGPPRHGLPRARRPDPARAARPARDRRCDRRRAGGPVRDVDAGGLEAPHRARAGGPHHATPGGAAAPLQPQPRRDRPPRRLARRLPPAHGGEVRADRRAARP